LKQVDKFKYIVTLTISDGRCISEIESQTAFQNMMNILCNMSISLEVKNNVLQCYKDSILLYGSEVWRIDTKARKHPDVTEMLFHRRKVPWPDTTE
jgi:hypothetical protein